MVRIPFPELSAAEAAALIDHDMLVGFSGFTPAGSPKVVPLALADRARAEQAEGRPFRIRLLSGASTGAEVDDALAEADAISWRVPFQTSSPLRRQINAQQCEFLDLHLSHVPQMIDFGFLGEIDVAIIEAIDLTPDGRIYLSTSSGISPTLLHHAKKVVIELNRRHNPRLWELHDILRLPRPPHRHPIPIEHALSRIGTPFARVDPKRIVGVVETDQADGVGEYAPANDVSDRIAQHVVRFLLDEMRAGRIPPEFLPFQAGVGNISNAVMHGLGTHPDVPPFTMFTEVLQDSQVDSMISGQLRAASTAALVLSPGKLQTVYDDMDFFAPRLIIRPQELSNNPEFIRRLGVIAINVPLEVDIYGNANSTHVAGSTVMNGIGGSGDFMRNAYLSIFVSPSTAKGGRISAVVPMVSHVDHNEHTIQIFVTEHGVADLRGHGPLERARRVIDNCAAPEYRPYLNRYLAKAAAGHVPHSLDRCFELHLNYLETGRMLPDPDR